MSDQITDLLDGAKLSVTMKAKPGPGQVATTEEVFVRRIPICDMDVLSGAWGTPKKEVAVYCDQPAAWVDKLSDDSFIAVMDKGRQLNFTSYAKHFAWQMQTMEALGQKDAMSALMKDIAAKAETMLKTGVAASLPASPPSSNS